MNTKYLAALRIPIVVLCLLGTGLAAYLFVYVSHQTDYLVGRDFRLLATIGREIEESIANDRRILSNLFVLPNKRLVEKSLSDERVRQADFVPILRSATIVAWPDQAPKARSSQGPSGTDVLLLQFLERDSLATWIRREESPAVKRAQATVQLGLDDLLAPVLKREVQRGIFDVLLVASNEGRVIFQTEDQKARITRLDALTNQSDPRNPAPRKFEDLARAPAMVDVVISGSRYKLFTWPCCGSMTPGGAPPSGSGDGWVLGGLVAEQLLAAESHAASFSIMACVLAVLLLAAFSWPFLKLSLVGETQRVRAHDVVLVGLGALLGLSLLTVSILDLFAYQRLEMVLDQQLEAFAQEISQKAHGEIASAYDELTRLEHVAGSSTRLSMAGIGNLATSELFKEGDFDAYPFFDSFSILDEHGFQLRKLTFSSFVPPLIDVNDREYFTYWRSAHSAAAFLQPVQSATNGVREAVLSTRVPGTKLEVATLSIPMLAMIDPVIAPGFGFAIIGQDGRVLFHSDRQHRLSENFFVESDRSRRLRSLVAAKRTEWLDFKYWGDDHRAFVVPMDPVIDRPGHRRITVAPMSGWTIVAFYDRDLIRAVNVEWLVLAAMFVSVYAGIYVMICMALLVVRPKYRAPWLWPDPARSKAYLDLFAPLSLLVAAFLVAIAVLSHSDLLFFAGVLPFLAWAVAYITLTDRPAWRGLRWPVVIELVLALPLLALAQRAGSPVWRGMLSALVAGGAGWPVVTAWAAWAVSRRGSGKVSPLAPPVAVSYGLAAALLLLLTTVLPAASFFRIGHGMQIESFIKYGELQSELQRVERAQAEAESAKQFLPTYEKLHDLRAQSPDWGMYSTFFAPNPQQSASTGTCVEERRSALPEEIEEVLPFYSESSVLMRELVHDQAADKSWEWRRCGAVLEFHRPAGGPVAARWAVPAFFESTAAAGTGMLYLGAGALLVGAILGWVVRFVLRKVFLVDVIEPLWSGAGESVRDLWGPHLFLVSGTPVSAALRAPGYCEVDLAGAPATEAQEDPWFADQLDRITHAPAGQNVLILHFEHGITDRAFNERKLGLLEGIVDVMNRTVVIVSAAPASLFTAANPLRWSKLLTRFTIVPVARAANPATAPATASSGALMGDLRHAGWREIVWRINALGFAHNTRFLDDECRDPRIGRLWKEVLPFAWHPDRPPLDVEQLLVEVGERAENYYQEIWATCTPAEKLVLGQIAEEGLVNPKTARTVRMLMARGLLRRQPHFQLMNESFRQFVLSSVPRREVQSLEGQSPSTWDSVRWPFVILLGSALAFFFATQHELFNTTLGVITGVGAAVPALVKIAGIFGDRSSQS